MDVQLINLEGSDARLGKARAALDAAGIPFRRLPAFDGRKLRPDELPLYDAERASRDYGRKLTGEAALAAQERHFHLCFRSALLHTLLAQAGISARRQKAQTRFGQTFALSLFCILRILDLQ